MDQQPRTLQLVIMVVFLIALAGFVTELMMTDVTPDGDQKPAEEQSSTDETGERTPPNGYVLETDEETNVSLFIPEGASTSTPTENRLSVKFLGPNNEPATKIQDGFTFTVFRDAGTTATSLDAYADAHMEELAELGLAVTDTPEPATIAGMDARTYAHASQLGTPVTKYLFYIGDGTGYSISFTIHGGRGPEYRTMVRTMLDSIEFTVR